ncbi:MAG TPA: hypothetical protein VGF53_01020 [Pseudolabrys sp.]|jgi:hypothetical protein
MRSIRAFPLAILGLLVAAVHSPCVRAEVLVQGQAANIRLEARDATVNEILEALRARFALGIHVTSANRRVTATYEGPLRKIVAHVLDGYDYVIMPRGDNIEVIVVGTGSPTPRATVPPAPIISRRAD